MTRILKWDYPLFYITLALVVFGFFMLSSAAIGLVGRRDGVNPTIVIIKQIMLGGGLGFLLLVIFSKLNYKLWFRFSLPILILASALMLAVFDNDHARKCNVRLAARYRDIGHYRLRGDWSFFCGRGSNRASGARWLSYLVCGRHNNPI